MEPRHGAVRTPDGRGLTTYTWGDGDDLVVFEAGLGASGRCWAPVIRLLPGGVRAVAYDRAGYGTSDSAPGDRTLDALAADLVSVVHAQGSQRVVLVGHSWGAPVVRRAAELLPAGVVRSLVLVDPSDEHANAYFTRGARAMDRVQALTLPLLARTGLLRAVLRKGFERFLPDDDLDATIRASCSRSAVSASISENRQIRAGLRQLRDSSASSSVPTIVVSGTKPTRSMGRRDLVAAHRRSVAARPGWRLVEASASTHYVLLTEPGLVAQEIQRAG